MKESQFLIGIAVSFVIALSSTHASVPAEQLKQSIDEVLSIIKNPELKGDDRKKERRQQLADVLEKRFHFREMSKRALGRQWNKLGRAERDEFVDVFKKLLEATYLARIEQEADGKVVFGRERTLGNNKLVVETQVITVDKEIPIHYNMMLNGNTWGIYDVKIEGVGLIKNYRTQFREILQKKSFQELLKQLKEKTETADN